MQFSQYTLLPIGFKRSALAVTMTAVASPLLAEQPQELPISQANAQAENSYKVDQSTSSKYTQPLVDTAKSITVIPQSVLKDRSVDSLRDALRNVPGITLAAGEGGTPAGDSMSIRGFDSRNNIMIDNVRDIAGYYRDMYNVEAVEVAKGPGSAVYGRGSTGGSINLQTKTAHLEEFNDVAVRLGTEGDYRGQLDGNYTLGESTALRVNLLSQDGEVAGRNEANNATNAIAVSLANGLGSDSRFNLNADYQQQDNLPDYGLPWVGQGTSPVAELAPYEGKAPPVNYDNFYGNVFRDFEDITAQSITAKYERDIANSTTLRALARVGSVSRKSVVSAPRFIDVSSSTNVRLSDEKTRDTKDSLAVVQVDLIGRYQIGAVVHNLITGLELAQEKFERWNYDDNGTDNLDTTPEVVDLYHPNSRVNYLGTYQRINKDDEATGDTTAFYVFDTLTFNPQWQLSLGLRYDIFTTEYFYDLSGADPSAKLAAENNEFSWSLGLVYKPHDNGTVYFGAGNSFSPSAEDLTASSNPNYNANDLSPEQTINLELGTKWELMNGKVFANAAVFRTAKVNARTDDPMFDADSPEGNRSGYETLNGEQRVDGLELGLAGQVTEKLSVTGGYTYQNSEVTHAEGDDASQEGLALPRTPEHSVSIWSRYEFSDRLVLGAGAQYVSERYNNSSPTRRERAGDYWLLDMMVSYQFNRQWRLQLNGSNLADEDYEDQLGGGHFIPGEGRYLSLTTSYSF